MAPTPPPPRGSSLLALRLASQLLGPHDLTSPAAVVAWMGALQAQDFSASRWAVGVRLPGSTDADVARAISEGAVVRTHLFRGTWQLVAAEDLRWMLDLIAPRVLAARASRERRLGLDAAAFRRSRRILARALAHRHLTRDEIGAALGRGGLAANGDRLAHVLQRAELEGLISSGALRDRTPTFALLDERVPQARRRLARDEALRELALRHARGRGPVTAADLACWAGVTLRDARDGLEAARPALVAAHAGGERWWRAADGPPPAPLRGALLLPAFDEYLIGYRDRSAALAEEHARGVNDGGGMLAPCAVIAGRVLGVWRRTGAGRSQRLELSPFERLPAAAQRGVQAAARRYAAFIGLAVMLSSADAPVGGGQRRRWARVGGHERATWPGGARGRLGRLRLTGTGAAGIGSRGARRRDVAHARGAGDGDEP